MTATIECHNPMARYVERDALAEYAASDWNAFDYRVYRMEPLWFQLRGPVTWDGQSPFVAYIGAAQTFGRYCLHPYPAIIRRTLPIQFVNLGAAGAGPAFYIRKRTLGLLKAAKAVVIQVMSGRSVSNSLLENPHAGGALKRRDLAQSEPEFALDVWKSVLRDYGPAFTLRLAEETRQVYMAEMKTLLQSIPAKKVLLWFSRRAPDYQMQTGKIESVFGDFPQLVNRDVLASFKHLADGYVEVVTDRGLPQPLFNRFTGEPHLQNPGMPNVFANRYYASPEMQDDAAAMLGPVLKKLLTPASAVRAFGAPRGNARPRPVTAVEDLNRKRLLLHKLPRKISMILRRKTPTHFPKNAASPQLKEVIGLLGIPRSGTTLVTSFLAVHSRIFAIYEPWNSGSHDKPVPEVITYSDFMRRFGRKVKGKPILLIKQAISEPYHAENLSGVLETIEPPLQRNLIILLRNPFHAFLSQVQARREWWGAPDLVMSPALFAQWAQSTLAAMKLLTQMARSFDALFLCYECFVESLDVRQALVAALGLNYEPAQNSYEQYLLAAVRQHRIRGDQSLREEAGPISAAPIERRDSELAQVQPIISDAKYYPQILRLAKLTSVLQKSGVARALTVPDSVTALADCASRD